jgi:hypothetical protein
MAPEVRLCTCSQCSEHLAFDPQVQQQVPGCWISRKQLEAHSRQEKVRKLQAKPDSITDASISEATLNQVVLEATLASHIPSQGKDPLFSLEQEDDTPMGLAKPDTRICEEDEDEGEDYCRELQNI